MNPPIITTDAWLKFQDFDTNEYENQSVYFISPTYQAFQNSAAIQDFNNNYNSLTRAFATEQAYLGYELVNYFVQTLKQAGVKNSFQKYFQSQKPYKGSILNGMDFKKSNDNRLVPILKFEAGQLQMIENNKE